MKYIFDDENEITQYDLYFDYIRSISDEIPKSLYDFVSDVERYDLRSSKSLHDSWLERINVTSPLFSFKNEDTELELSFYSVELVLFNRKTDFQHTLTYQAVSSLECSNLENNIVRPSDLLAHEFRLEERRYVHEILFENASSITIICENIVHSEVEKPGHKQKV